MSNKDEPASCRLYLVTPERLEPAAFADQLAAALDGGDVASVQLRLKNVDDDARMAADYDLVKTYIGLDTPYDVKTAYTNEFLDRSIKMTK